MKIAIIGYSGSGKSTLAGILGEHYGIPALYMDRVQFKENWVERDSEEGKKIVFEFMQNENWVIDGNYEKYFQKERLEQADQIIFMNFNRFNCFSRAVKRYLKYRNKSRPSMAEGCNEKLDLEFAKWLLWEGRTKDRKKRYGDIIELYKDKTIIIHNQRELDRFIKALL